MPLISQSTYRAPAWLPGGHLQTIFPALFRKVRHVTTEPERLELPDGDFVDLQWSRQGRSRLAILSHGLEGHAEAEYIQGMAAALVAAGWDVLAWTFRGCGREPNRLLRMYHSGATADLHAVVCHALAAHPASSVDLLGFSLGGNMTLKYMGENRVLSPRIHRAMAFSVPCDLACSARKLEAFSNKIYLARFLRTLRQKIRMKGSQFPGQLDLTGLSRVRTFQDFDTRFTAPLNGFRDAADYWKQSSCRPFLATISRPTLLVSAANDPFLGPRCYPWAEAAASHHFHLLVPETGGHVGFTAQKYASESLALEFLGNE